MLTEIEFMEGINLIQDNYQKTLSNEQLELFYENLKDMDVDKYMSNIKEHIRKCQFLPNIAQIRVGFDEQKMSNFQNMNLNSCYWYINERMWCDKNNVPYYDITDSTKVLLPYKEASYEN